MAWKQQPCPLAVLSRVSSARQIPQQRNPAQTSRCRAAPHYDSDSGLCTRAMTSNVVMGYGDQPRVFDTLIRRMRSGPSDWLTQTRSCRFDSCRVGSNSVAKSHKVFTALGVSCQPTFTFSKRVSNAAEIGAARLSLRSFWRTRPPAPSVHQIFSI